MEDGLGCLFLLIPLIPLLVSVIGSRMVDAAHDASLRSREAAVAGFRLSTLSGYPGGAGAKPPVLVAQNVCFSLDYFRSWIQGIRKLFGGEMIRYRALAERTRREALLRLIEEAKAQGYDALCNVRFEIVDIGYSPDSRKQGIVRIEIIASGTAYRVAGAAAA